MIKNLLKIPGLYKKVPSIFKFSVPRMFGKNAEFERKDYPCDKMRTKFDMINVCIAKSAISINVRNLKLPFVIQMTFATEICTLNFYGTVQKLWVTVMIVVILILLQKNNKGTVSKRCGPLFYYIKLDILFYNSYFDNTVYCLYLCNYIVRYIACNIEHRVSVIFFRLIKHIFNVSITNSS